jgi:hypothetical protein
LEKLLEVEQGYLNIGKEIQGGLKAAPIPEKKAYKEIEHFCEK